MPGTSESLRDAVAKHGETTSQHWRKIGFYSGLMKFNLILWWFNGIQWDLMGFYGGLMGFNGILW